eukprot:TRINITY_DN41576_c0_g1_i1.p1 TRINITY_DN41576_c0_g1~~TRINITY_DN41576_c0_g1_i1.p1  ORF type:complete len:497 (+),score=77.32 TRINITY_DN41576_c0_g1_i1:43-1533(+)
MADTYSGRSPHLAHRQRSENCIIKKDDVGRAKPSCRDLPPEDFAYGSAEPWSAMGEGVRDALSWSTHVPSPPPRPGTDYQRINKTAVTHHAVTPKELTQFRATHGDFPRSTPDRSRMRPSLIPSDVIPDFSYGKPGRPSTPVADVIAHQFGNESEEALEDRYRIYQEQRSLLASPLKFKTTKAERLRRKCREAKEMTPPDDPTTLWQMGKFKKVPAKLRQEAGLYRDEDGRLQRCRPMRSSASLPSLPQASPSSASNSPARVASVMEELEPDSDTLPWWDARNKELHGALTEAETEDCGQSQESLTPRHSSMSDHEVTEADSISQDVPAEEVADKKTTPCETPVELLFTVRHAGHEELQQVMGAIQRCVRSNFSDSAVKIKDFTIQQDRQASREQRGRYMAWGQAAMKASIPSEAGTPVRESVLSVLQLGLLLRHASKETLREVAGSVAEHICNAFALSGNVQLRKMSPSLWSPPPPPSPPKPAPRDGLGRRLVRQ